MSTILNQYVETALWSSIRNDGEPFDRDYSISDVAPETLVKAKADLDLFFETAGSILDDYDFETVAHDFWLTRNRHGAGFWDGDYSPEHGSILTKLAHSFGELDPVIGDDGLIYFE